MLVRKPFSPKIYDNFFDFLISQWNYSVEDALFLTDFVSTHKEFIVLKASPLRKNLNKFNSWTIYYRPTPESFPTTIYFGYLKEFIENDCLPF